jgi:hypothetical protein
MERNNVIERAADKAHWWDHRKALAAFFLDRYVVRTDCYGMYKKDGSPTTRKQPLIEPVLLWHCGGRTVGVHTTDPATQTCKVLHQDIDRHDDQGDPEKNEAFARSLYDKLAANHFNPLLLDSNGRGGYHLQVLWDRPVPAAQVRAFGLWLVQDYADYGVACPETFPKQDCLNEHRRFGNWFRLPGRHHKRDHWSKVWDGERWVSGAEAVRQILATVPVSADLIPEDAAAFTNPPRQVPKAEPWAGNGECGDNGGGHGYARLYRGDLKTLDVLGLFEAAGCLLGDRDAYPCPVVCPWADEHSDGRQEAFVWQDTDDDENRGWPRFFCHHAHCAGRALGDVLEFFGPERVNAACSRGYNRLDGFVAAEDLVDDFVAPADPEVRPDPPPAPDPAQGAGLDKYKDDPRTSYLWRGNHGRYVTDEERGRRVASIEDVWRLMPQEGFFPEYVKHWLPCTDAPVIFHLAGALAVAASLVNRRAYLVHGDTTVKPILWCALLAASSKMRKSTAIGMARRTLPDDHKKLLMPEAFSISAAVVRLGFYGKTQEEVDDQMLHFAMHLRDEDPTDLKGVGLLAVDELGALLGALEQQHNAGGKQMLTTLFDGEDWRYATKESGCYGIPQPHLSLLGGSTLEWLGKHTDEKDIGAGFFPRWLCFYADRPDYCLPIPDAPGDGAALRACKERLCGGPTAGFRRFNPDGTSEVRGQPHAPAKCLSDDAKDWYAEWVRRVTATTSEEMGSWSHRLAIYALKVAVLYEVTTTDSPAVSLDNVERACLLIDRIAKDTGIILADELSFGADDDIIKRVRKFVKAKRDVSGRDVSRHLSREPAKKLQAALDTLAGQGVVEGYPGPKGGDRFKWLG